nr:prolyl oligopeptidase family serine peptidase [Candidatus Njordarchaeum guaymaensis]
MHATLEEEVRFGEGGIYLHGLMHRGARDFPGVVLCAPHPNSGGTMDFYLLTELVRELSKERFTTLRFNYRDVYGGGSGEVEDIVMAVGFIRKQQNVNPERIALVGYSFGGSLVLVAAERAKPKAIVSISPSTRPSETKLDVVDYARRISIPVLLVHGTADEWVPYSESEKIHKAMENSKEKALHLIEGANHLYTGKGKAVISIVTTFLTKNI